MMNRHITQWHNPRECSAACARVEKVMQKLKALANSIDEEEGGRSKQMYSTPTPSSFSIKDRMPSPCEPMPANYRFPEPVGKTNQCCGKRNGLQDYCGPDCYMNPKANIMSRAQRMEEQKQAYQLERNQLRCVEESNKHHGAMPGCVGQECLNDFYLIPVDRNR